MKERWDIKIERPLIEKVILHGIGTRIIALHGRVISFFPFDDVLKFDGDIRRHTIVEMHPVGQCDLGMDLPSGRIHLKGECKAYIAFAIIDGVAHSVVACVLVGIAFLPQILVDDGNRLGTRRYILLVIVTIHPLFSFTLKQKLDFRISQIHNSEFRIHIFYSSKKDGGRTSFLLE